MNIIKTLIVMIYIFIQKNTAVIKKYFTNTAVIKKYFTSIKYIFICSNVN